MREYTHAPVSVFCRLLGVSRQAFYQYWNNQSTQGYEYQIIIDLVRQIRTDHPAIGTRKLYLMIAPHLRAHQIKLGRDKFYGLLSENGMLLRKRRRAIRTTYSNHPFRKYQNLIVGRLIEHPNQVWVSDITYWKVGDRFWYLTFITDAYSRKIVGYKLSTNLESRSSLEALKMAINSMEQPLAGLIHHSDRGIQYCTYEYIRMLNENQIQISMTQSGDPLENPQAERVNGIIKNEYLRHFKLKDFKHAQRVVDQVIYRYNNQRPHMSCNMMVPETIHESGQSILGKYNMSSYSRNNEYV